ncbi:MAG: hypothetical protein M3R71_00025 [Actinomycetota bacterium]|nr:hypothetical protein [Actinomycetota bacterium]
MEHPLPNPAKLLDAWMQWERGELPPGRVMADLKIGGLRDLLEALVAAAPVTVAQIPEPVETESWTPVV